VSQGVFIPEFIGRIRFCKDKLLGGGGFLFEAKSHLTGPNKKTNNRRKRRKTEKAIHVWQKKIDHGES